MQNIAVLIMIALFIEAIVDAVKPVWTKEAPFGIAEYVSMGLGILIAVTCKFNMLELVVDTGFPVYVEYIFYVLTGIAIGRGTNFMYDLWDRIKNAKADRE